MENKIASPSLDVPVVHRLHCEHLADPLGIGTAAPRFSWELQSLKRDVSQQAFRIMVGASPEIGGNSPELLWDSGRVESEASHGVCYAGEALQTRSGYYWRVKVWTNQGETGWSEPAHFETGFFSIDDWDSDWVSYRWTHLTKPERSVIHLRAEFATLPGKEIRRARLYVASTPGYEYDDALRMNLYVARLNGKRVADEVQNPGQLSDRRGRALYRTYDITERLRKGANAAGLIFLSAKISLQVFIEYADGAIQKISDCKAWRWYDRGPFTRLFRNDLEEYGGKSEIYDAREEYIGWDLPGFDDSAWRQPLKSNSAELLAAQMQSVEIGETLEPLSVIKRGEGRFVADFGKNMHGVVSLRVKGKVGVRVRIRYAEYAWENGDIDIVSTLASRNPEAHVHEDIYIKRSGDPEDYVPQFSTHGFRYVEVAGYGGELLPADIRAHFVHSTVCNGGEFICSDPWVQRLHDLSMRSCLSNLASVPTDGPSRERQGWLGDAGVCLSLAESIYFDMRLFYEKWFNDIEDMQEANGFIPYICPFRNNGLSGMDIPWSTGAVAAAWNAYMHYGDHRFLETHYDMLRRWAEYVERLPVFDGLSRGNSRWNDHLAEVYCSLEFVENVYCFRTFDLFSKIAKEAGQWADMAHFQDRAAERREAINRRFLNSEGHYLPENIQSSNAHALYFGIVPEASRDVVFAKFVESLETQRHFTTGILGTFCAVLAMAEGGRNDLMYQLVKSDEPRTWGYWIKSYDATCAPEYWVHDPHVRGGTLNNPAFAGGLAAWFYQELAGITPTSPGYKTICVKPYIPEDLGEVSLTIHSVHGRIRSAWKQSGGQLRMDVEIPPNTRAEIYVPGASDEVICEGDVSTAQAPGIRCCGYHHACHVFEVGSGRYQFIRG